MTSRQRRVTVAAVAVVVAAVLVVGVIAAGFPRAASATTLQKLSVGRLARHAVSVVRGRVVAVRSQGSGADVRTVVRLRVAEALKGPARTSITVVVPGGRAPDGSRVVVGGMPSFAPGDRCVVFVDVFGRVVGGFQGAYELQDGFVRGTGEPVASFGRRVAAALGQERPAKTGAPQAGPRSGASGAVRRVPGGPVITSISPSEASAGTDSRVTITGSGFGSYGGSVLFPYGRNGTATIASTFISRWSDTSITCTVPTDWIDDYAASAGSGPVVVVTSAGLQSNGYEITVPFGYGSARWPATTVTYRVNTSGIDTALRTSLLDAGAGMWNALGTGFTFVDGGPINAGLGADGINVVSWAGGMAYGILATTYSFVTGHVVKEIDIQFSNAFAWGDGAPDSETYDVQSTASHEFGHWLVLLDQYMLQDAGKIMYGYESKNVQRRTPAPGDVAGIQWIYGGGPAPSPTATPTPTTSPSSSPTASPTPTPGPTTVDLGPVCRVQNAAVKRGAIAVIRYMVTDDIDLVVTRSISISTRAGVVKRRWTGVTRSSSSWQTFRFTCDLKKGTYRIEVGATDLAGHPATAVGRATLTVR